MTSAAFNDSIRGTHTILRECDILRTVAHLRSTVGSAEFRELALIPDTPYRDLYLCGLQNVDYNFLLKDYAFLQFTHFQNDHYRCTYYPNPFSGIGDALNDELEAAVTDGTLSFEEYSQYLSEQPYEVRIPIIRFELDHDAYVMLRHPAAHFRIGMHTENRWPVSRELTPRSFTLLLAKLYYFEAWITNGAMAVDGDGFENRFDRQSATEKQGCVLLAAQLFDQKERALLHMA